MKNLACFLTALFLVFASHARTGKTTNGTSIPPIADFFFDPADSIGYSGSASFCQGGSLLLTANYAPAGSSFQWTKNGFNIAGATSNTYVASATGIYSVVVTHSGNPANWPSVNVTVNPNPVASFNFSPNGQCSSTPIDFTSTSTGAGLSHAWNFGDPNSGAANTSTLANPSHNFWGTYTGGAQNFNVILTVTTAAGCSASDTQQVATSSPSTLLGGTGFLTYNGQPFFTKCASNASTLTFTNQSSSSNSSYTIVWGDGSPDFTAASFASINHTYLVGAYALQFIVTAQNGCKDTGFYNVFVGSNPAVGLSTNGNSFICTGSSLSFPVSNTANNPPGTTYTINFGDNTNPLVFTNGAPASVSHVFDVGSCGVNTNTSFPNSFTATIIASNPCGTSASSVVPIYVSQKGHALIGYAPKDTVCTTTPVTITNVSANSFGVSTTGTCSPGKGTWSITPATGWTLTSGILGNDFGTDDPDLWINGSSSIGITFNVPGNYTVKLKTATNGLCGSDSAVKTFCVNPVPTASFTLSSVKGCTPVTVNTTNNSSTPNCGFSTYNWTVTYSNAAGCAPSTSNYVYLNGTSATSANPQFEFINPGVYTITLVTRAPGGTCSSAPLSQTVTVKTKPVVTLSAPATVCQNASMSPTATVNNCYADNPATYQWDFPGSNTPVSTAQVPGTITYNTPGTYAVTLTVTNECGSTVVTQQLVVKPAPDVTVPANAAFCAGAGAGPYSFTSGLAGTIYTWSNSAPSIGLAASGSGNIGAFTTVNAGATPVTATIVVTPSNNGCPGPSQTFTLTVNPKPAAPAVTTPVTYCQDATPAALTATALPGHTLLWYTTPTGGTGDPAAPTPSTASTGTTTYYVSQAATATGCEGNRAAIQVVVKPTPVISNSSFANPTTCGSATGSITLNGLATGTSYSVSYIKNSTPVTVNIVATPPGNLVIGGLTAGNYSNVTVSLNGCPSNLVGPFALSDPNPPPAPVPGSNSAVCEGSTLNLSATAIAGVSFSWSGPNSFSSTQQNPSISNVSLAANGNYTLTISQSGCTSSASITVTVNPRPAKPAVVRPVLYCLNATASPLQGTASAGNTLAWYDNATLINGQSTPFTPATATAGTTTYYVTQSNGFGCASDTSIIPVIVYPVITSNTVDSSQSICSGNAPSAFFQAGTLSGGNGTYSYQWEVSTDGGATWTTIAGATSAGYGPGPLTATTRYRRVVTSGPCANSVSNEIVVTVQGSLGNYDISAAQTICAGTAPQTLNGQMPTGGTGSFGYQWQSSPNGSAWTDIAGATGIDYTPGTLATTTHFRRKTTSGPCSAFSSAIIITVVPVPVMTAQSNLTYCTGTNVPSIAFGSAPSAGTSYSWTNSNAATGLGAAGNGNLPAFATQNNSSPKVPEVSIVSVTPTNTVNGVGCAGAAASFTITVLPSVSIEPVPDTVLCTGTSLPAYTPVHDAGPFAGAVISYGWTRTGSGVTLAASGTGAQVPAYSTSNAGTIDLVATITITPRYTYNGTTCAGTPVTYTVTVKPATPAAGGGPDTTLCAAASYTMQASATGGGQWTQLNGAAVTITTPASPTTTITGLQPANAYQFVWTVTGFANCPPTKDTVTIIVTGALVNTVDTATRTICSGQSVGIPGQLPSGGSGIYTYQWQQSADSISWTPISGQTGINLSFTPTQTLWVRRVVTALPCSGSSDPVRIIVQPPLTSNTVTASQGICINTTAVPLQGSLPSGGNGTYLYQWQQSTDNGTTWTDISGATGQDYSPGALTLTTRYRRLVSSTLCAGPQGSTSNVVIITVNPNAKALFNPSPDTACAPFFINGTVINLQPFPANNGSYQWYVDGTLAGTGTAFPGHTINGAASSAVVKLVAVSAFGCLSDSMSHTFYTRTNPQPGFTLSDTVGCGPLPVLITNTTPNGGQFAYQWNFGNGQTSTQAQPGTIVFAPNPTYGDTSYIVKLSVLSACGVFPVQDTIRVKSKPKALFAPSASTGCSPMTVTFNNITKGLGVSYSWNFGDGTAVVNTPSAAPVQHTFYTGVLDTFYVKLIATNECGSDSLTYAIVVHPNAVHLDFAINGNQQSGCTPHAVSFINNSQGATTFTWDFGDGTIINTTQNIDTLTHAYLAPGTYTVVLHASNGCSDTTSTETITVYPKPVAAFTANPVTACIGTPVSFTNGSAGATSYLWQFGDNTTSAATNPTKVYTTAGIYTVKLKAFRFNPVGSVCTDSVTQQVQIVDGLPGAFAVSDSVGTCAPFAVTFTNLNTPAATTVWTFGDGNGGTGNVISHTYQLPGIYSVKLVATAPGGCVHTSIRTIKVLGPSGTWTHSTGYLCNNASASFQVQANNTDSLLFSFGDGATLTTTANVVYHSYTNPGIYFPTVTLKNNAGCTVLLTGIDSIRVDRVKAGFTASQLASCGYTRVNFQDTSFAFFGKAQTTWDFGDGTGGAGSNVLHDYTTSGTYPVTLIVKGVSGCSDTVTRNITVTVKSKPHATVQGPSASCVNYTAGFSANIQSNDAVNFVKWTLSNGASITGNLFSYKFTQAGNYTLQLVVGTVAGCYDTAVHSIVVNPSPVITTANDLTLCRGNSAVLNTTGIGVVQYNWAPLQGLSCFTCASPVATPLQTTPYVVQGTNTFGCSAYDTVVVTVIQPLHLAVGPSDTICTGGSANLLASGAAVYSWSPAAGLNSTTLSNPTASPAVTTRYRVVGYDGYNCFTDTAYVLVAVGQYPTVNLGADLTLAAGTVKPLTSVVTNGPIKQWVWTPVDNLSCSNCALPLATVKKDITYTVKVTNIYGCSASDTLVIKAFCESTQVFIPNAFTPDGDGLNDILMVRGSGIVTVKSFRIFNRWGEVVFERANFPPNNPAYGWNGSVKGVIGGADVFVYTAEVICENGASFTYKGNVSIIK